MMMMMMMMMIHRGVEVDAGDEGAGGAGGGGGVVAPEGPGEAVLGRRGRVDLHEEVEINY